MLDPSCWNFVPDPDPPHMNVFTWKKPKTTKIYQHYLKIHICSSMYSNATLRVCMCTNYHLLEKTRPKILLIFMESKAKICKSIEKLVNPFFSPVNCCNIHNQICIKIIVLSMHTTK